MRKGTDRPENTEDAEIWLYSREEYQVYTIASKNPLHQKGILQTGIPSGWQHKGKQI